MSNNSQLSWLLFQGLIPLFGASVVYLIWGAFKKLASSESHYAWREAIDSMGWLYGAIIIAVQAGARFFEVGTSYRAVGFLCAFCAMLCGMQLLVAMNERGENPRWQAPFSFKIMAIFFVAVILACAYFSQGIAKPVTPPSISQSCAGRSNES